MSITRKQGILLDKSKFWENLTAQEIVEFQLYEETLCMPFGKFHGAVEKALGRRVLTHEFAHPDALRREFRALPTKNTESV